MADSKVPLADVRVPEDEIAAIAETYRSGWLRMGPETERFEVALARHPGRVTLCNGQRPTANGTGNELA